MANKWRITILVFMTVEVLLPSAERRSAPVLVELFTSEGCSSCPPADQLLATLDQNPDLIVLSEHVDYWDQQGWRDPYSSAGVTARQEEYSRRFHLESVYTPEMVIDGRVEASGNDRSAITAAIAKAGAAAKTSVELSDVTREGGKIHFRVRTPELKTRATVFIALAEDRARSEVARGENSGRTLDHVAVVRKLQPLKATDLDKPMTLSLGWEPKTGVRVIAFLTDRGSGAVIGVARFPGLL